MNHKQQSRFLYLAATLATAAAMCGCGKESTATAAPGSPGAPGALPNIRTVSPLPANDWTTPEGDLAGTRFSTLSQINTGNVANLKVVFSRATGIPQGHEGGPLVLNNTMYMITPFPNDLLAIDLKNPQGPLKWTYSPLPDP